MKKSALVLVVFMTLLFSCSSDSSGSDSPVVVAPSALVKKITTSDSAGKVLVTTTFSYDGNKIVSESWKQNSFSMGTDVGYSYRMDYTYTGNLITNIKVNNIFGVPEKLVMSTNFVYDSNENLISSIREQYFDSFKMIFKVLYTKIDNNTQEFKMFTTDSRDNIENSSASVKIVFDANRNIIKMGSIDGTNTYSSFEYDLKSNPKKNILGFNKMIYFDLPPNFSVIYSKPHLDRSNTVLKTNISGYYPTTNQYTYNTNGYPIERKEYYEYNGDKLNAIFQYFYE
ncbi:hypothetical protein [Flavobacterium sp. WC2429]|uniref:DUF4595 domain-containing protein n=2 Tax=unclassified Flavobacterium TaxID=196869 RepID=A0AB39WFQ5_9FLAO